MRQLCAAAFAALFTLGPGLPAHAQDVTLTSRDGSVEINGSLIGYDGEFFRIDTEYGALTLDGSGVACTGPGCPDLQAYVARLTIAGSRTMGESLLPALIEAFARTHRLKSRRVYQNDDRFSYALSDASSGNLAGEITFELSNTETGFNAFLSGAADLVMATRELTPAEIERASASGLGDMSSTARSRIVALDALVPIVARDNPVETIALEDLARILSGEISNWSDIGGIDAPIILHLRDRGSGVFQGLIKHVFPNGEPENGIISRRYVNNSTLSDAVAADPYALGIGSFSEIGNTRPVALTGGCGFPFSASLQSLKAEDYPLTMPLFLYTPPRRLPKLAREFLTFLRGSAAQRIVRSVGFVDQDAVEIPIGEQGQRLVNAIALAGAETPLKELQRMVDVLRPGRRLSTTFRFETGSSQLDAQSRANVARFAQALEAGIYDGQELLFVGFSDGDGGAAVNLQIAKRRARTVLDAVMAAAPAADWNRLGYGVDAFGEAMPMACDDTAWGRQVNRRVEVWVRPKGLEKPG